MSQRVPSRELFHGSLFSFPIGYNDPALYGAAQLQMGDTESVAELTWQNGQLAMQGLSHQVVTKPVPKYPSAAAATWEKPGPSGTLESIINQATRSHLLSKGLPSWTNSVTADAIVPCSDADRVPYPPPRMKRPKLTETGRNCTSQGSCAPVTGKGESTIVTLDNTWADDVGFTTNSASPEEVGFTPSSASPEGGGSPDTDNTSIGGGRPTTTLDDHDSFCHSRPSLQRDGGGEEDEKVSKGETERSAVCLKRRRASAIHNQSERKRRDKINERMKALQKMVPNSSKTDKASMLDEVIEYLKALQAQVQMMNRMSSMSHLMMPMPLAAMAQYQMSMLANMAQLSQMGMGMGMMDINHPGLPSILHPPASLHAWGAANDRIPPTSAAAAIADPISAFLPGTTQQPMGVDAFSRMAAMYQQLYPQAPQPVPKP